MLLGVIADDFTGASDIANTLAKGGLSVVQYLGVPSDTTPSACEAGIVALKSRSTPAEDAVTQALAALRWLKAQGCRQFVFKYCSTFDSTLEGNIGPVGEALARELGVLGVPACPAFPGAGRTVYQGHLFVGDRLLNESGMETHPLNPMTDADIRRWLARQSTDPVGLVPLATVRAGEEAIGAALEAGAGRGERLVIVDALTDDDLFAIGHACADVVLVTGGSGIAIGLPGNFIKRGLTSGRGSAYAPQAGAEAILAGSCSRATLEQIAVHAGGHPAMALDAAELMTGAVTPEAAVSFIRENTGHAPLIYSSATADAVRAVQERFGREAVATRLDAFFAEVARQAVANGVRRLVVAGGETSGAVVSALGLKALAIGPEIDPGVPALSALDGAPLALALKSGNFGARDFFAKALGMLGAPA